MLIDVGMMKTYSKSAHVNDLGFAWTGWPPLCMDWPSSLFLRFFCQVVLSCRYTLHHPYICLCFRRKHFYTPFALMVSSSQGKERFVLPSIRENAKKTTGLRFSMHYLLIPMHCITCYMALDHLSCCKCLLVYVTFYHTHWSADEPRIVSKVLTEHLDFKIFPWGGACPQPPLVYVTSSMA